MIVGRKNKEVPELPRGKAPPGSAIVHIVQGGNSRQTTLGAIRAYHEANT